MGVVVFLMITVTTCILASSTELYSKTQSELEHVSTHAYTHSLLKLQCGMSCGSKNESSTLNKSS